MNAVAYRTLLIAALGCVMLGSGCAAPRPAGPYQSVSAAQRDSMRAQRLTAEAAELTGSDPQRAEDLLREALTADLYHGPAHNNLGVIHLQRGQLYEAANEFEWARKLMPGHPDPRLNLALTLERAGRVDEALAACDSALQVYPGHIASQQQLARLQLRHQRADSRTGDLLREIVMRGTSPQWQDWARQQLLRLPP